MGVLETVSLKVCEKIIKQSTFSGKTILKQLVTSSNNENVQVEILTGEDKFKFTLCLIKKEKETNNKVNTNNFWQSKWYIQDKNYSVVIKDVTVKGYVTIHHGEVDLTCLKLIVETLAGNHAKSIKEKNMEMFSNTDFFAYKEYQQLISALLDFLKREGDGQIDPTMFAEGVQKLVDSSKATLDGGGLYVKGNIFSTQFFLKNTKTTPNECKMMKIGPEFNVPLVYDVLLTIFSFSNQIIRQHHFEELLNYYYTTLQNNLSEVSLDLKKFLSLKTYYRQVNQFLPFVKLEITIQYCLEGSTEREVRNIAMTSLLELNECILYPNLTREDCYKIIENKVGSSDYNFLSYKVIPIDTRQGFLGDYFKVKINILHNNRIDLLNMFAKYLPSTGDLTREIAMDSFVNEEFVYRTFIPKLIDLGLGDICDFLPKCYFSRSNDVLIFEDLSVQNYSSVSISENFSYDLLNVSLKSLAKLHACSLLYEEIMTKKTKSAVRIDCLHEDYVKEKFFNENVENGSKKVVQCALKTICQMIDLFPNIPKKLTIQEFKEKVKSAFDLLYKKIKRSDKYRNVLCQGDFWSSNILFKTDEGNRIVDSRIVDYQLTRYCPPAADLLFIFYMTTNKETREEYMTELIRRYYLELSTIFNKYNFDLTKIYTYDHFLDSCNYMRLHAICHTAIILQVCLYPKEKMERILSNPEKATHLFCVERTEFIEEMLIEGAYRTRVKEIIEELYDICENENVYF